MSDQQTELGDGKTMSVLAYGDNVAEVEMDALDKARAFFGPEIRLEVNPRYGVVDHCGMRGCRYYASVQVREVI